MISGSAFAELLERHGFDFAAGVPCSLIEGLVKVTPEQASVPRIPHTPEAMRDRFRAAAAGG